MVVIGVLPHLFINFLAANTCDAVNGVIADVVKFDVEDVVSGSVDGRCSEDDDDPEHFISMGTETYENN